MRELGADDIPQEGKLGALCGALVRAYEDLRLRSAVQPAPDGERVAEYERLRKEAMGLAAWWGAGEATAGEVAAAQRELDQIVLPLLAAPDALREAAAECADAAIAYDAAIQRHAAKGKSWVDGDDLDALYAAWINATHALRAALATEGGSVPEQPKGVLQEAILALRICALYKNHATPHNATLRPDQCAALLREIGRRAALATEGGSDG
jgi:hypothetical protein